LFIYLNFVTKNYHIYEPAVRDTPRKVQIYDKLMFMSDISTSSADLVAAYIRLKMVEFDLTQKDIQNKLTETIGARSKGYVSGRVSGKYAYSVAELDAIAPMIGLHDAFDVMSNAERTMQDPSALSEEVRKKLALTNMFGMAANTNPDKEAEKRLDAGD
jgi:hypothetical protein